MKAQKLSYGLFWQKKFNIKNVFVFPIGKILSKPNCISIFLAELIMELKDLMEDGIAIENKGRALTYDAPAKGFACGIIGRTSSYGCTKCIQVDKKITYVLSYSQMSAELIKNANFSSRKYLNHHLK